MTTPSSTRNEVEQLYRDYQSLLMSVAYRMLGSKSEAEDVVQDVFVAVSRIDMNTVAYPKTYLVKMVTNRVLNVMKSAPRKRENYPGQWLPEPDIELSPDDAPLDRVIKREQLGYAMLVLLQTCTPPERAVFVLRESFGYEYADIAAMLDKSEAACRKLFSRASAKIGHAEHKEGEAAFDRAIERFVQSFAEAVDTGRIDSFIHLLTDDAVLLSDGGGVVRAAINPIEGSKRIVAFFKGIAGKGSLSGRFIQVRVSGQIGLLLLRNDRPGFVLTFDPADDLGAIRSVYMVSNPQKLEQLRDQQIK
jgi:RNA polymerase sigma-70 factor (ECF subfamily)